MSPFALSAAAAREYLESQGIRSSSARVLGGGVSNTVVLVETTSGDRLILKQALPQLRVADEWLADRGRIFRERDGLVEAARLLPQGWVPRVLWSDDENFLYAMEAASPEAASWKERLLAGDLRPAHARAAGQALGMTIAGTWRDPSLEARFGDQRAFEQLRTDPYYRTVARRHRNIADAVEDWIRATAPLRLAVTHGDWSPKNMLVDGGRLIFIDYECMHFGDPSYDLAFCTNHLCLKAFHDPERAPAFLGLARNLLDAVKEQLEPPMLQGLESRAARHLSFLMLARVDGKSPAEYLQGEYVRDRVRRTAMKLIDQRPASLEAVLDFLSEAFVADQRIEGSAGDRRRFAPGAAASAH